MNPKSADELRAKTSKGLKCFCPTKPEQLKMWPKELKELRRDNSWVIPTADKGVAMVVPDKQDYISKMENLSGHFDAYNT